MARQKQAYTCKNGTSYRIGRGYCPTYAYSSAFKPPADFHWELSEEPTPHYASTECSRRYYFKLVPGDRNAT